MLITIIISLVLPETVALTVWYFTVRIIQAQLRLPPLVSVGTVDFYLSDIVFVVVSLKILFKALLRKRELSFNFQRIIPRSFLFFLMIMLSSTVISYFRFGSFVFLSELISFLRFLYLQLGEFVLLSISLRSPKDMDLLQKSVFYLGYIAAGSILLGWILHGYGYNIGEINPGQGFTRYQGVLGDSVKLFLLPFVFYEVIKGKFFSSAFFIITLLLTGGRLGYIGLIVGLFVIFFTEKGVFFRSMTRIGAVFIVMVTLAFGTLMNLGGLAERFTGQRLEYGFGRRVTTWLLSLKMFLDNWFTGLGFQAYRNFYPNYLYEIKGNYIYSPFATETFSQFLKSMVDGGIWGLIAFLWMMKEFTNILGRSRSYANGDILIFLKSGYIYSIVLFILSPFVAWFLPSAKVSLLYLMFVVAGLRAPSLFGKIRQG